MPTLTMSERQLRALWSFAHGLQLTGGRPALKMQPETEWRTDPVELTDENALTNAEIADLNRRFVEFFAPLPDETVTIEVRPNPFIEGKALGGR